MKRIFPFCLAGLLFVAVMSMPRYVRSDRPDMLVAVGAAIGLMAALLVVIVVPWAVRRKPEKYACSHEMLRDLLPESDMELNEVLAKAGGEVPKDCKGWRGSDRDIIVWLIERICSKDGDRWRTIISRAQDVNYQELWKMYDAQRKAVDTVLADNDAEVCALRAAIEDLKQRQSGLENDHAALTECRRILTEAFEKPECYCADARRMRDALAAALRMAWHVRDCSWEVKTVRDHGGSDVIAKARAALYHQGRRK